MIGSSDTQLGRGRVSWMRRASAVLMLLRPINVLMFCAGVFLGGFLAVGGGVADPNLLPRLTIGALAVAAIGGAANSLNDVIDIDIDRINRPHRPIASGVVSRQTGVRVWLIVSIFGLVLSALLSPLHLVISGAAAGALIAYSFVLKRVALVGNVLVAALVALSIIFGALAVGSIDGVIYAAAFAFLLTFVREMIKDAADVRGDAAYAARTFASVFGRRAAVRLAGIVVFGTILLTPLPFLLSAYSTLYLSLVLIADIVLIWALWAAAPLDDRGLDRSGDLLKWAMIAGMAALAAAHTLE